LKENWNWKIEKRKTKQNKYIMETDNLIETLLDSITPEETARIENRMLISAKIADAMKEKGWKKKDLMQILENTINRKLPVG
jgi:hypothetical protein